MIRKFLNYSDFVRKYSKLIFILSYYTEDKVYFPIKAILFNLRNIMLAHAYAYAVGMLYFMPVVRKLALHA